MVFLAVNHKKKKEKKRRKIHICRKSALQKEAAAQHSWVELKYVVFVFLDHKLCIGCAVSPSPCCPNGFDVFVVSSFFTLTLTRLRREC